MYYTRATFVFPHRQYSLYIDTLHLFLRGALIQIRTTYTRSLNIGKYERVPGLYVSNLGANGVVLFPTAP